MRISEFIDLMSFRYKLEKWNEKKGKWEEIDRSLSYYSIKCLMKEIEKQEQKGIYRIIKKCDTYVV